MRWGTSKSGSMKSAQQRRSGAPRATSLLCCPAGGQSPKPVGAHGASTRRCALGRPRRYEKRLAQEAQEAQRVRNELKMQLADLMQQLSDEQRAKASAVEQRAKARAHMCNPDTFATVSAADTCTRLRRRADGGGA